MLLAAKPANAVMGRLWLLGPAQKQSPRLTVPCESWPPSVAQVQACLEQTNHADKEEPGFLEVAGQTFSYWQNQVHRTGPSKQPWWSCWAVELTQEQYGKLMQHQPIGVVKVLHQINHNQEEVL